MISLKWLLPGVQASFDKGFSKKMYQIDKRQKIRQSLFTFCLNSIDLPSIWQVLSTKFFKNLISRFFNKIRFKTCWDILMYKYLNKLLALILQSLPLTIHDCFQFFKMSQFNF